MQSYGNLNNLNPVKPNKRLLTAMLTAITISSSVYADAVDDYAIGRKGEALKGTLQKHYTPLRLTEPDLVYKTVCEISGNIDRFTGKATGTETSHTTVGAALHPDWLRMWPEKKDAASRDMHNLGLIDKSAEAERATRPLGDVTDVKIQGDGWAIGYAPYGENDRMECFEPAAEYKGDFARIMFYTATIYPATLWYDWGNVIFETNTYPTLRKEAAATYIKWHREDPVDEQERILNGKIENIQGNRNPFIDHPELAEYLWGDKKDMPYRGGTSTDPENPDRTKIPLHGVYKLSDLYIDLYSPYVSADARWTVDGKSASGTLSTHTLGTGTHELRYTTENEKGKLLITIEP